MTLIISLFMVFYIFKIFYRVRKRKEEIKREGGMRRRQKVREGEGWGDRGGGEREVHCVQAAPFRKRSQL